MPPVTRFTWRHQYDDARDNQERARTEVVCEDPSLTIQSFTQEADINHIVKNFGIKDGGKLPDAPDPRYYGDFSGIGDFRDALQKTKDANDKFAELPAHIRGLFSNDPTALYEWVSDPENAEQAVELGLLAKRQEPPKAAPIEVIVTNPEPPKTPATTGVT